MGYLALAQQGAFGTYDPRRQYALAPSPASLAGGYGQQQPFGQQFGGPTPQMPQSPLAALQQPLAANKLAPFALNQPTPEMALNQVPFGAGARGPTMAPGKSPAPGGGMGGFMGRLQSGVADLPNNSLFQLGMSLLGNAQNGGNWGQVGQDMMAFSDRQRQRQIQDNEMRRQKVSDGRAEEMYGWTQEDRQREAARRQRFGEYLPTVQDPELRAILEAAGPESWGEVLAGERGWNREVEQRALDRAAQVEASRASAERRQRLTDRQIVDARTTIANAGRLRNSYNNFIELLRNASDAALAGIGPEGATLAGAHRLLAMQAKSPAALDLGALVGADFSILNDIIGEPGNLTQLVRQGGREGALARLEPFGAFIQDGASTLRQTYDPYADDPRLSDILETLAVPELPENVSPPPPATTGGSSGWPTPPPQAIQMLRENSSAERRRQFDATFGPGAAARYLAVTQQGVALDERGRVFR